jgi:hypothetical protein
MCADAIHRPIRPFLSDPGRMLAEGVHGGQLTGGAGQRTQNRLLNFLLRHARTPLPGRDECKAKYLYDKV